MCDRSGYLLWVPAFFLLLPIWEKDCVPAQKFTRPQKPFILLAIDIGIARVRDSSNRLAAGSGSAPLGTIAFQNGSKPIECKLPSSGPHFQKQPDVRFHARIKETL
jgi:hypothetical protein